MPGAGFDIMQFAPLVLIFVVFYFLLIRPQQKKAKEHRQLLSNVRRGDSVVTSGGIVGTVTKADDSELLVEIAKGVEVRVLRATLTDVLSKPVPVPASKTAAEKPARAPRKTAANKDEKPADDKPAVTDEAPKA